MLPKKIIAIQSVSVTLTSSNFGQMIKCWRFWPVLWQKLTNNLAANIGPYNRHLVLKQVPALANHFTLSFAQTLVQQVVQTNSVYQEIRNTYLQFNCSLDLTWEFVSFDRRVHQTHSNKNRICSDNWSSCNAQISLVKTWNIIQVLYQLKIA